MFSNIFYKQIDGVAMGSPCGPALVSIIICSFENKQFKNCSHGLISVFYKRYVDDIFVLLSSLDHAEKFKTYLSSKHANINFSLEKEIDGCLSFSDINVFREKGKFATSVYRRKAFSDVYSNFNSFVPETYKPLIKSLLFRCFSIAKEIIHLTSLTNV